MIQAIDLTKRYEDGLLALDHLNLHIQPGQIYCLLGANGAGKTTTINLFFNFIEPTGGTATLNGVDCTKEPREAKKFAAYVSENVMLYGNFTARQNLVKMKKGDRAFFYHSNEGKEIVGIAEIIKEAYPDPTDKTGKFVCVDIKADKPLKTPVTMAAIKADKRLADMALVKYSRLSVQPVTPDEWKIVCKMGGL